jgi:hypothetical protein
MYAESSHAVVLIAARRFDETLPRVAAIEGRRAGSRATHWNTVSLMLRRVLARGRSRGPPRC